ncbi:MAG: thiamine phosphate synthase [Wenzhouxiangellaceae bacterium]|nr:thiamine phosphate synthase [Wenzhouxiangellaceae bacterium]
MAACKTGLYALTPVGLTGPDLLAAVCAALAGGAVWLQYRGKEHADPALAAELSSACRDAGAVFIVNDDVELAARVGADGVHLGRDDAPLEHARRVLGPDAIVGESCYDDLERAARFAGAGADYLAFGSMFASPTKPDAVRCPPDVLERARRFGKPVVAIGGITLENAPALIEAGADLLAVISDLFEAPDIRARAEAYVRLFG